MVFQLWASAPVDRVGRTYLAEYATSTPAIMAVPTFARLSRFIGSIFAPATAIFGFSCLLTFIFVLYQPHAGPGAIQRLGWQSWDSISDYGVGASSQPATGGHASEDVELPGSGAIDEPVDWWNVTAPEETYDYASLPLDVWDPLMPHDTGCESLCHAYKCIR